MKTHKSRKR